MRNQGEESQLLLDKNGQPLEKNFKSASTKIRQIAKQAAKRNIASKIVEKELDKGMKVDMFKAQEILQEQFPNKLRNLEAAIDKEIQKNDPDINKLVA